jgi:nucleotide-binding universal stress UspA family protein
MKIKKILVPIDFSEFSDKALDFALLIAEQFGAALEIVHAVVLFQDDIDEEQRLLEYEEQLKRKEKRIRNSMEDNRQKVKSKGIRVKSQILRGISAADVILDYLNDHVFDMVIMGTHGRTGLKHLLHGSVAEKVVRLSPAPVLTVHRSVKDLQLKKLLVPIDFSNHCKEATEQAVSLAKKFESRIGFIHVIEHEIHPSFYASGIESIFEVDLNLKTRVIENMQEFLQDQLSPEIETDFIVEEGKAHKVIVEYAEENDTDMIVIATHGLTGLDYILLGSTTEKVIRWANCLVLTVRRSD